MFKGENEQNSFCHLFLTLMMFQTCMTLFFGVFKEILDTYNDLMNSI